MFTLIKIRKFQIYCISFLVRLNVEILNLFFYIRDNLRKDYLINFNLQGYFSGIFKILIKNLILIQTFEERKQNESEKYINFLFCDTILKNIFF
jgi:hypothetical protein